MTEHPSLPEDEAERRAASLIARALAALRAPGDRDSLRDEVQAARRAIDDLAERLERRFAVEREQQQLLGGNLAALAGSLERLVAHLQELTRLVGAMLKEGAAVPPPAIEEEPAFMPGGEGVSLAIAPVPGFQALMDIQKALMRLEAVSGVSVERYQEGDSRLVLHLQAPLRPGEVARSLQAAISLGVVVEEAKPEVFRLRLKLLPA